MTIFKYPSYDLSTYVLRKLGIHKIRRSKLGHVITYDN